MRKIIIPLLLSLLAIPFGCNKTDPPPSVRTLTYKSTEYEGRLIHEWMELGYQMVKDNYLYGPHAARIYGYLGLTAWEAVCHGLETGKSMAGQINDYTEATPFDDTRAYDWGIVLCAAMRTVFPELVDNINNAQRSQVEVLASLQEAEMIQNGRTELERQDSKALGARIGMRILERIRRDGREDIRNSVPVLPVRDDAHKWYWDANTLGQKPVEPLWSTIRTFVIDNAQTCESDPPFPYSNDTASDFYREAKEVYNVVRSPENKAIAYHWDNGPGRTCSPACHWVNITEQLLKRENKNLAESAKAYCLVGFAAADGFSACWLSKYKYFLLRPVTYIREQIDPAWSPLIGTPPYPDYISGSSVIGGAAPLVLIETFGDIGFVDKTHLGSPLYTADGGPFVLPERTFSSLTLAGEEQMRSRIIGGVHFRRACEEGLETGRCIAQAILSRLDFGI